MLNNMTFCSNVSTKKLDVMKVFLMVNQNILILKQVLHFSAQLAS